MELIFIVPLLASLGVLLHFLVPHHDRLGVALLPAVALVAGTLVWVALTWAGLGSASEQVWLAWLLAPVVGIAAALITGLMLGRSRVATEESYVANFGKA